MDMAERRGEFIGGRAKLGADGGSEEVSIMET